MNFFIVNKACSLETMITLKWAYQAYEQCVSEIQEWSLSCNKIISSTSPLRSIPKQMSVYSDIYKRKWIIKTEPPNN